MLFISFNIPDKLIQPIEALIHFTSCITEGAIIEKFLPTAGLRRSLLDGYGFI